MTDLQTIQLTYENEIEVVIANHINEAIDESVDLIATSFKDNCSTPLDANCIDAICRIIKRRLTKMEVIW